MVIVTILIKDCKKLLFKYNEAKKFALVPASKMVIAHVNGAKGLQFKYSWGSFSHCNNSMATYTFFI
jgi:hypothetical protein